MFNKCFNTTKLPICGDLYGPVRGTPVSNIKISFWLVSHIQISKFPVSKFHYFAISNIKFCLVVYQNLIPYEKLPVYTVPYNTYDRFLRNQIWLSKCTLNDQAREGRKYSAIHSCYSWIGYFNPCQIEKVPGGSLGIKISFELVSNIKI